MKKEKRDKKPRKGIKAVSLFIMSIIFISIACIFTIVGCNFVTNRDFKESFYSVSSLKVNNKIRVIQISDLHNCIYGAGNRELIDRVTKLKPDLIIYTGDCVDSYAATEEDVVALCGTLAKVAPSYYIYGNNEVERYYNEPLTQESLDKMFGFTDENRDPNKLLEISDVLRERLEEVGVKVLKNGYDTITVGTTTVDVFGVLTSNPSSFWSYAGENFDQFIYTNENNLKITAIHEPLVFEEYTPNSWGDVLLAGHTHGGIARIPMLGPVYAYDGGFLPERNGHYVYGRYDVLGKPLVVSSGLENETFLRINNQPEITIIDINKF